MQFQMMLDQLLRPDVFSFQDSEDICVEERLYAKQSYWTVLVAETLHQAGAHIPFYQKHFTANRFAPHEFGSLVDLNRIPVIDRRTVLSHTDEMVNCSRPCWGIKSTSGTTMLGEDSSEKATRRLVIPYCREEIEYVGRLRRLLRRVANNEEKRLVLLVHFPSRRIGQTTVDSAPDEIVIRAPLALDFPHYFSRYDYFDHVATLLFSGFRIHGVEKTFSEVRFIPAFLLRLFTEEARRRKIDLQASGVREIVCAGDYLSPTERTQMERAWRARVSSSYSFAESHGAAGACPIRPGVFHFDLMQFIQVIDNEGKPVGVGREGRLVVTTLFPFHIMHPFLRYAVGDLVQREPECCECGFVGQSISYIGRDGQCVDLSPVLSPACKRIYLGTSYLISVLDAIGEIPKCISYRFAYRPDRLDNGAILVSIIIEAGPARWFSRQGELCERIIEGLLSIDDAWREAARARRLHFDIRLLDVGERMDYFYLGS